jgi:hypothetical protein
MSGSANIQNSPRAPYIAKSINIKSFQPFLRTTFTALDGIEIIYLQERLHVLVNILAMGQLSLIVLPPAHNYNIGCRATIAPKGLLLRMSAVIYSKITM